MRGLQLVAGVAVLLVSSLLGVGGASGNGPGPASGAAEAAHSPYDLVWISDSSGWGAAAFYARQIRKGMNVPVRLHDEWKLDLAAATILERLRTPSDSWVRLVRDAEVIVVYGNPLGLGIKNVESGACHTGTCIRPVESTLRQWRRYIATLKTIFQQIFAIRNGEPVILRTANWYVPVIAHPANPVPPFPSGKSLEQCRIIDACTRFQESNAEAIATAAAAYKVPVADIYRAFNGPSHREDPVAKGYLQPDNIHPNDRGRALIAKTVAALGYKPVTPIRP
jgi:hypothetical protein